jgi:UDP:flavonoid glycosyltransferase YjiC (YdhE family)
LPISPKRVLLATIGSLGDLHPMLALALGLRERGHRPSVAATDLYRAKVEGLGLEFRPLRPHTGAQDPEVMRVVMDMRRGPEFLLRKLILSALADTYDDLLAAAAGADLMIAGEIVFAAPLVAEKLRMPWVSAILSPFSFYSTYDPPVSPYLPSLDLLSARTRPLNRAVIALGRLGTRHWFDPVRQLRRKVGLGPGGHPLFEDKFSRDLTLALFSPQIAPPQPDWPSNTIQPGFVYYDRDDARSSLPPELEAFLQAGEGRPEAAPIVFTLGSSAVHDPRGFFEESAKAARILNRRAVFLIGQNPPPELTADSIALPYAPFSELFPRAAVVVHQGGSGTTAQALRAGRPALVMPCGFDQPDNAARVKRIGAGLSISRGRYKGRAAAGKLARLLDDPFFAANAEAIGRRIRIEDGLGGACEVIERLLATAAR